MPTPRPTTQENQSFWYILLAAIVGVLALAGYAGYVLYPRFDLPAATGSASSSWPRGRASPRSSPPARSRCW